MAIAIGLRWSHFG